MDALAELRARQYKRMIEETDDVCKGCERRHTGGFIGEFQCHECGQQWRRDTAGTWVHADQAHSNCRRKPCPYCKALRDADAGDATGSMSEDEERASSRWAR